ncbi:MAG: TatA/E family twin arginine-targeting protein translocase [Xenococcaceae cyanobacterium MO_188.B19]|nr:TatA/E family twin arginine-targeting protein translocase [Xenococcaceae cyanobacterium MO_188.B19]
MNIFGIGLPEMVLIMVVALLIFGPKKLPEIGRSLGKTIRSFQDASREFETEFKKEAQKIEESVKMSAELEASQEEKAEFADKPQDSVVKETSNTNSTETI